ncbi:MAG: hypothetical protein N4A33_12100 [Bacteriovoracaceae bacterium]|jgi:hypothetical protein|nr:hypothetical protein [Bacteriovoracaceae bacterium]
MKLIILLTISITSFASTLKFNLDKKTFNYAGVDTMYKKLVQFAKDENEQKFCKYIVDHVEDLKTIYSDDYDLFVDLKKEQNDIADEYADKIYNNSMSDLFAFSSYEKSCEDGSITPLSKQLLYLDRSIMNNTLLINSHKLFIEGYLR